MNHERICRAMVQEVRGRTRATITTMIGIVDTSAGAKARCQRITRDNFWDHVQKLMSKFVLVRHSLGKLGPQMYAGYVAQFPLSAKVFAAMYPACYTNSGGPAGCPAALAAPRRGLRQRWSLALRSGPCAARSR